MKLCIITTWIDCILASTYVYLILDPKYVQMKKEGLHPTCVLKAYMKELNVTWKALDGESWTH